MSPTFLVARESIAVISGSGSDNATTPEGGNASESSSPEKSELTPDVAINVWSSGGAPKETGGVPHSAEVPAWSDGKPADCGVLEGWGTPLGEALTVILKSPGFFFFFFFYSTGCSGALGAGTNARSRQRDPAMFDIGNARVIRYL